MKQIFLIGRIVLVKNYQSLMTCVATLAAGVACADLTPFDKLDLTTHSAFSATATVGGTTNCSLSDNAPTPADGYFVLESELTTTPSLLVTPTSAEKKDIEKFEVAFKAAFVDPTELPSSVPDAKIGFALTSATSAKYYGGSQWNDLTTTPLPTIVEDADYTLRIDYDGRQNKARFVLTKNGAETPAYTSDWVGVGAVVSNVIGILGSGSIKSLGGTTFTISAEVIEITPEGETSPIDIKLTPAQITAIGDPTSTAKLANGHTALTSYILFGKAHGDVTAEDVPVVKGNPTGGDASNVAISIPNLKLQTVTGATVSFQLQGRATTEAEWQNVGDANATGAFTFPANTSYRYFKVVTTITYGTAQ